MNISIIQNIILPSFWLFNSTGAWSLTKQIAWSREATLQSWKICWRCWTPCTPIPWGKHSFSQPLWPWLAACPPGSCRRRRRTWTSGASSKFLLRKWGSSPNQRSLTWPGRRQQWRPSQRRESTARRRRRTSTFITSCCSILDAPWYLPTVLIASRGWTPFWLSWTVLLCLFTPTCTRNNGSKTWSALQRGTGGFCMCL